MLKPNKIKPGTMNINPSLHQTPHQLHEEEVWIQRAKKSPEHFGPLYKKYHEQIFRFIYQRMNDKDVASDVTSQVFIKAMDNLKRYQYRGLPFSSWLYRIAYSEVIQFFRDKKAVQYVNAESLQIMDIIEDFDNRLSSKENIGKLMNCLKTLKATDVEMIEMRYFENRSYKEISEIKDITENSAKVKTFRALERLKTKFL